MDGGMTVLITGGAGNLAGKLAAHLDGLDWCRRILLVDRVATTAPPKKAEVIVSDLADPRGDWRKHIGDADAVVHFAADNPSSDCSWAEATRSFDITGNVVLEAAQRHCRCVFASSNHVMGRYKEEELPPGGLTVDLPPLPGTRFHMRSGLQDSPAYATSKLMGERLLLTSAAISGGRLTGVALRIGWCQPGKNHPDTISASEVPFGGNLGPQGEVEIRDLTWFRNMWLSNRDFVGLFAAAIRTSADHWPEAGIVVNAMSANRGMPWDLAASERLLGYRPQDDIWAELGR